ncbi:3-oxoacyl-reductase [Podospora australis]|uniref:3-oxoacyl-reductase n=1 Tax=Podospora australis TaxID=1536484 RepID=A0AAN6WMN6_9PEZI|nr:3-oxoacyl-reductase [Podospora australis]
MVQGQRRGKYQPPRPSRSLRGKVAIVTGAGSHGSSIGNGRATSILLAEDGASLVCVDRDLSAAKYTVEMIHSSYPSVEAVPVEGDVTSPTSCSSIVDQALAAYGRLDILVNVVGIIGAKGNCTELDLEEWNTGLEVNVTSMMLMSRYAIPAMLSGKGEQEDDGGTEGEIRGKMEGEIKGAIVNIGSVAGLRGGTPHLLYPTTKGAVVNMTRAMAAHHGGQGVRVNCVCPGMLYTPMMYVPGMSEEMREKRKKRSLLGTEGNAWDCASAVRFLASDEARWITGAVLAVDAGATAAVSSDSES